MRIPTRLMMILPLVLTLQSAMATEPTYAVDIPAQPLTSALDALSRQTGLQPFYADGALTDKHVPALKGRFSKTEALNKLLGSSGLAYNFTGTNTVAVKAQDKGKTETLPAVTVVGAYDTNGNSGDSESLTTPSIAQSLRKLRQVPGGTTLIEGERIKEGAAITVNDTFAYAPGVYVGDSSGSVAGGSRISIRGSDINSIFSPIRGVKILRDALPFTHANGFTDTEYLNWPIEQVEVYRGANALQYGSSNLGGAINYITPTGYTADKLKFGMTWGNNGYVKPSVSSGGVLGGGWDAFGSFSYVDFNGIRDRTDQELFYGYGNLGYRWNENNETRLHVDIQNIDYQAWPSSLSQRQLDQNPHQNTSTSIPKNGFPVYMFDLQHTVRMDDGDRFDFGAYYFNADFSFTDAQWGFYRDLWQDAGFSWRHQINGTLFGMNNRFVWGGLTQWMWINDHENEAVNGVRGPFRFNERDDWNNVEAFFEDQLKLSDSFTLVAGAQINYRKVSYDHLFPELAAGQPTQGDQDFFNFNPKLGFTWQASKDAQLYGNVSRSAEPPPTSDLADIYQTPKLTSQTGTTVEIGSRGQIASLKWDLAFYNAWLEDELLIIPNPTNPLVFSTANAEDTLHTGIELGLESTLPLNWFAAQDQIRLRGSYTWSLFQFNDDPVLGNNRLPGIPEHNARFEVLYQHPDGFYAGPNLQAVSSNWVDFANTQAARPYALLGARAGWDDGRHWKVFVDGRNLTNERYAASVWVTGNSQGQDLAQLNPGATRMVFGGFEYRY